VERRGRRPSASRATVRGVIEASPRDLTLYDTLAVVAPAGADRGQTTVTLSKETTDGDAEGFAIPKELFGARRA
jgi:hypothetical protein